MAGRRCPERVGGVQFADPVAALAGGDLAGFDDHLGDVGGAVLVAVGGDLVGGVGDQVDAEAAGGGLGDGLAFGFFGQQHGDDGVDAAEAEQGVVHQVGPVGSAEEDHLAAVVRVAKELQKLGEQVLGDGIAGRVAAGADVGLIQFIHEHEHRRQAT